MIRIEITLLEAEVIFRIARADGLSLLTFLETGSISGNVVKYIEQCLINVLVYIQTGARPL